MASRMQQNKDVTQFLESEKAKLEEQMKDTKNSLEGATSDQITAMALCEFRSSFHHQSRHYINKSWTGNFMTRVPEFINGGDGVTVVHKGSKGGIIYGLLPDNPRSAVWLLSWFKPNNASQPSRVYVRAGTREKLVRSSIWTDVEPQLNQAGDYSQHYDPETGAVITARIRNDSGKVAIVGVSLSLQNI